MSIIERKNKNMEIQIKKADITYLTEIQNLSNQLFELEYHNFDSTLELGWALGKEGKDYCEKMLKNKIVYVALDKNRVVGYLAGNINMQINQQANSIAKIDNIFVLEKYRKYGIGSKLIIQFKEFCLQNKVEEIKVTTYAQNQIAIQFYRKNGFQESEITLKQKVNSTFQDEANLFVLHSLNGDTIKIWGQDLKNHFNKQNIDVFLPEFPIRADSTYEKFKKILQVYFDNCILNQNSIVIAHSIGNAYFIRFCQEMNYIPKAYIAVAPGAVYNIPSNRNDYTVKVKEQAYCKQEQLDFIKEKVDIKYCFYSDEGENKEEIFKKFIKDTGSIGVYLKYYNHFDGYHRIYKIPELIELINKILKSESRIEK